MILFYEMIFKLNRLNRLTARSSMKLRGSISSALNTRGFQVTSFPSRYGHNIHHKDSKDMHHTKHWHQLQGWLRPHASCVPSMQGHDIQHKDSEHPDHTKQRHQLQASCVPSMQCHDIQHRDSEHIDHTRHRHQLQGWLQLHASYGHDVQGDHNIHDDHKLYMDNIHPIEHQPLA